MYLDKYIFKYQPTFNKYSGRGHFSVWCPDSMRALHKAVPITPSEPSTSTFIYRMCQYFL